jgi:hypothetical protein
LIQRFSSVGSLRRWVVCMILGIVFVRPKRIRITVLDPGAVPRLMNNHIIAPSDAVL